MTAEVLTLEMFLALDTETCAKYLLQRWVSSQRISLYGITSVNDVAPEE